MADLWEWSQSAKRYRNLDTGRFLPHATIVRLRDEFLDNQLHRADDLAALLARGDITVQRWELEMRDVVKQVHGTLYTFGRGGRNAMTQSDWGWVGHEVRNQYGFLHQFSAEVAAGNLSPTQVAARSRLYVHAGVTAHGRGVMGAFGGLSLPAQPGDGGTECMSRCRCHWDIQESDTVWEATWVLDGGAQHCAGCSARADEYAPYRQEKAA